MRKNKSFLCKISLPLVRFPCYLVPAMQIERKTTTNEYSAATFRLCVFKGEYTKGQNIFTSWLTASSAVAVHVNRKDAANILRRIRAEKRLRLKYA